MEQRSHAEAQGKGAGIVDKIRKWSHDNLTLKGREDKIYQKKYDKIAESLPNNVPESQMALIELKLREQAKSGAVGSMVMDALLVGGGLVGGGLLINKMKNNAPLLSATQRQAIGRMEQRADRVFKGVKDVAYGTVKTSMDVAMFGMKLVVKPIEFGAKVVFWPVRQVGRAGSYLFSLVGGPEAIRGVGALGQAAVDLGAEALKAPVYVAKGVDTLSTGVGNAVEKTYSKVGKTTESLFTKLRNRWNKIKA